MTLVNTVLVITGIFILLAGIIAILPDASEHPLPIAFTTAVTTLVAWLYYFNMVLPVDTLFQVVLLGIVIEVLVDIIIPVLMWIFKGITRSHF